MEDRGALDLSFIGNIFTWSNKRIVPNVRERLDRVISYSNWRVHFPCAEVRHLVRCSSNHLPILFVPFSDMCKGHRPFRFLKI